MDSGVGLAALTKRHLQCSSPAGPTNIYGTIYEDAGKPSASSGRVTKRTPHSPCSQCCVLQHVICVRAIPKDSVGNPIHPSALQSNELEETLVAVAANT